MLRGCCATALVIAVAASPVARAQAQVPTDTLRAPVAPAPTLVDATARRDSTPQPPAVMLAPRPGVFAGSDRENDLRTLQLLGVVPLHPWSVRSFGPGELARFTMIDTVPLPRSLRSDWCAGCLAVGASPRAGLLPVEASAWFNSARAFGMNDGAVWAGRGLTVAATGGVHGSVGPLSVVIAPVVTWAQNQAFALDPNGQPDSLRFADAMFPRSIDHPQRFGDGAVARLDPGESTIRLDIAGAAAGISTASQWWGPMTAYPYLLGNNAGGFPHVFFGTARPANVWVGRLHARVIYGGLAESAYSPAADSARRRFASGIVAVFMPRGLPGFEIGGARFFTSIWSDDGITSTDLKKPFEGVLKVSTPARNPDGTFTEDVHNQLAAVFARLALPASGVEVYGEYGRDDHNADLRDFLVEPDHDSEFGLGLRRAWRSGESVVSVITVESANFRISHLARARPQVPPYIHGVIDQGHTHRGQPLGIAIGARSGDALTLQYQRHGRRGSTTFRLSRHGEAGIAESADRLVRFIAGAERSVLRGPLAITGGLTLVQREGRDEAASDTNVNVSLSARWLPDLP